MHIQFHGAARTVTGSMHLVEVGGRRILLDCGLYQGKRAEANERNRSMPIDPASIDAIVLSHAHIDHSGKLPMIVAGGFIGKIYCTPATLDLCSIMLADSGHIQEKDAEFLNKKNRRQGEPPVMPLYTAGDAARAMGQFVAVPYRTPFDVLPGITAEFFDAGHILGSASVRLLLQSNGTQRVLGFTGDVGRWNTPIIKDPEPMGEVDALISESTYGGIVNDPPGDMEQLLAADLKRTVDRGGKIIVPAFSVGRTQELVYALHDLFDQGKMPPIPVYIDSPLAVNATDIFSKHPDCFDEETWVHLHRNHNPFTFSRLTYVRSVEESKKLNDIKGPCMIISASGMAEAGRILHHLANNIGDERNTVLIVGYQAEHTLGRRLVEQAPEVKIFGDIYERKAEVIVHNGFSAHADGSELIKYMNTYSKRRLEQIYLVHGELERAEKLRAGLLHEGFRGVTIPVSGQKADI